MGSTEHSLNTSGLGYLLKFLSALVATVLILIRFTYLKQQQKHDPHHPTHRRKHNKPSTVKGWMGVFSSCISKGRVYFFFFKVLLSLTVIFIYHIILTPGMSAHVISILCFFSQGLNMLLAFFPISLKRTTKKELFEGYLTPTYFSNLKVQFFLSCHM